MFLKLILLLFLSDFVFGELLLPQTAVETSVGRVLGLVESDYKAFLGIPYGLVDENDPFATAKPYPHFATPYRAFTDSTVCPQYFKGVIKGILQCLHLNVYTPRTPSPWPLPVMVYIHGGAFTEGNGAHTTYLPTFLVRHDVILVTINYRLGAYGHLCLPKHSNQSLKDQQRALRWVKDNIESFGGDSENILLFGHSSGSISTELHLLYNNENLFNKVILQSGPVGTPFLTEVTDLKTIVRDFGMDTENVNYDSLVRSFSNLAAEDLVNRTKIYNFRPCIDGEFITKMPKMKNLQNIKIMIGGTQRESLYFYAQEIIENFDYIAELDKGFRILNNNEIQDGGAEAVKHIKNFYSYSLKDNLVDFVSDFAFNYPMERSVRYYLDNNSTVYRYLFTYDGGRNFMKIRDNIHAPGATHGDELGYLFDMKMLGNMTERDQAIVDRISLLWTNFAKYGNPTPTPSPVLLTWPPVTAGQRPYLLIDTNERIDSGPFQSRMAFWHLFYDKYGRYAKGISLGEPWQKLANNAYRLDLSTICLLVPLLLLCQ